MATRWLGDSPFPGMVELNFRERDGTDITVREKCAVIDAELCRESRFPVMVALDVEVLATGPAGVTVRLCHGVEAVTGRTAFCVAPDQLLGRRRPG